jgi:hypothetical protein
MGKEGDELAVMTFLEVHIRIAELVLDRPPCARCELRHQRIIALPARLAAVADYLQRP